MYLLPNKTVKYKLLVMNFKLKIPMKYIYKIIALLFVAVIGQQVKAQTTTDSLQLRGGSNQIKLLAQPSTAAYSIQLPLTIPAKNQFLGISSATGTTGIASWLDSTAFKNTYWSLTGNAGTNSGINFLGTTDDKDLIFKRNNVQAGWLTNTSSNTAFGVLSLPTTSTGVNNTANGYHALTVNTTGNNNVGVGRDALATNTTGSYNTAVGVAALIANNANYNTAIGSSALYATTTGGSNVALGYSALANNTTGSNNVANGVNALIYNTTGTTNVAIGTGALLSNTTGSNNVANGVNALNSNVAGLNAVAIGYLSQYYANNTTTAYINSNTSVGCQSLQGSGTPANNTGTNNTAIGYQSMFNNTSGNANVAVGHGVLLNNTTGVGNTASGYTAMLNNTAGGSNVAYGSAALRNNTTGNSNVAIGNAALNANTTADNNTAIGTFALTHNTTGIDNTATGRDAGNGNTTGIDNTAIGHAALFSNTTGNGNTAVGKNTLANFTSGIDNVALGHNAGSVVTSGDNNIFIGSNTQSATVAGSNQLNIGSSIFGTGLTGTVAAPAGNIGINQTAPTNTLEIKSTTANTSGLTFTNLTSISPVTAGATALGVDAGGKVVTVAATATYYKGRVLCTGVTSQTISDANVTATATIIITYEDPAGGAVISTAVGARTAGTSFSVLFGAIPPTTAYINYTIMP
jgi:hypothetical protein